MSSKKPKQSELPFILEGNTAPRTVVRSISKVADGLHKIQLESIKIRPGFNARRQPKGMKDDLWEQILMIPQLADAIFASNGPAEPILGDFYKEDSCFYVTNGERRLRALRHLMRTEREIYPNGNAVFEVTVLLNPFGTTDLDRKRKVISTQDNLKLKPMERAYYYLSFIEENGMTHEQLATFLQVSRQTIDNYIQATELPLEVQEKVDSDEIKLTAALIDFRMARKEAKGKKGLAIVDTETGEIIEGAPKKEDPKGDGDEGEFTQQDNSITGAGSMGG